MQLITNTLLLLAVSATAMASTTHHGHKQPQQLTSQGHYRHHISRANITGVNPNLGMSDNKPAHAGHTGCGGGAVNVVEDSSTLPPASPPLPLPLPPADASSPAVRPVPSGSGIPTGGVKPTPFVYVSGTGVGVVVRDVVVAGMGLGAVVAVLL